MNNSRHHNAIKNFFTKDVGVKIFSLVAALFMWFLVMNTINPTETRSFSANITFENMEELVSKGYVVTNQEYIEGTLVNIRVQGSRPALDELAKPENRNSIFAKIDLSKIEADTNAQFPQKYQVALVPSLPSGLYVYSYEIASYFPTVAEIEIDTVKTETAELQLSVTGSPAEGYIASEPKADLAEIEVSGPAGKMQLIDSVTAHIDIDGASQNVTKQCRPAVYDKNGNELHGFFVNPENIQVSVNINKQNEITINEPETTGVLPPHLKLDSITYEPKSITAKSSPDLTPARNYIDLPVIDLSSITATTKQTVDITDQLRQLGLTADSSQRKITVTINVSVISSQQYVINKSDIKINSLPANYTASIPDDVKVEIGGRSINTAELNPSVNLSQCRLGRNSVPLDLKLPQGASLKENVSVTVVVSDKITENENIAIESPPAEETDTTTTEEETVTTTEEKE